MKKLKQVLFMFALCFSIFAVSPLTQITVYASETESGGGSNEESTGITDTGNAIQDILSDRRFEGAISSIGKITNFIDNYFIQIISLVSFFIISAALLKNACAGAYCANSKFWDKVADAHQKTEALNLAGVKNFFAGGQGIMNTTPGGIRDFFLGLVPNIKAFTDFEDADIEPKAYFMKAIPQMIACVIIGIFIYNGYYRDTAATVGEMGSVLIERTLGSVNPDSFVNRIFNTTGWPKSPWEKDKSREGQWKQSMFKELRSIVTSNYTDITSAQQKAAAVTGLVQAVENTCSSLFSQYAASQDGYIYQMSGISSYASSYLTGDNYNTIESDGTDNMTGTFQFRLDDATIGASTARNSSNDTAYVTFTLKKVADDGSQGISNISTGDWGTQAGKDGLALKNESGITIASASQSGVAVGEGKVSIPNGATFPLTNWIDKTDNLTLAQIPPTLVNKVKIDYSSGGAVIKFTGDVSIDTKDLNNGAICLGKLQHRQSGATSDWIYLGFQ